MTRTKHVYRNNVIDWYVATSPEHAAVLCFEYEQGLGLEPDDIDDQRLVFDQVPDDKPLTIHQEDAPRGQPDKVTKTCGEWAAESEPGLLCSTEW